MEILSVVMNKILPVVLGVAGIAFIIAFHEFGHLIFCKIFNIKAPSFSIGFGPRLIAKKIGETEYVLSAIPLGGYVEIAGSAEVGQGEQTEAYSTDDRAFGPRPWIQKFLVVMGGITFNLLFAYVVFSLLYFTGMPQSMILYPKNATSTVNAVMPGSPAELAGIQSGDIILSINNVTLQAPFGPELVQEIKTHPNQLLTVRVQRENSVHDINVTTKSIEFAGKTMGTSGIVFETSRMAPLSFVDSIKRGIQLTNEGIVNAMNGLMHIFAKRDATGMMGPVGIIAETANGARQGFASLLLFLALISISLAVLNLLPIPILDGGQLVYYTIESISGRSIPEKVREYIHIACWLAFLLFMVYVSYQDIIKIVRPYIDSFLSLIGKGK
jgi:regulator of sigma E protease